MPEDCPLKQAARTIPVIELAAEEPPRPEFRPAAPGSPHFGASTLVATDAAAVARGLGELADAVRRLIDRGLKPELCGIPSPPQFAAKGIGVDCLCARVHGIPVRFLGSYSHAAQKYLLTADIIASHA